MAKVTGSGGISRLQVGEKEAGPGKYEYCSEAWTLRHSTGGGDSFQWEVEHG